MSPSLEQPTIEAPKKKQVVETPTKEGLVVAIEPQKVSKDEKKALREREKTQERAKRQLQETTTLMAMRELLPERSAHKQEIHDLVVDNAVKAGIPPDMAQNLHDRWAVLGKLGEGAQGKVYEAIDVNLSQPDRAKKAALKQLNPDVEQLGATPEEQKAKLARFRDMFIREAQAMAKINSPHVVRVYDADWNEKGSAWYAMDMVEGTELRDQMHERMPVPQLIDAAEQMAAGLQDIHEAGIVHRDIKPENVYFNTKTNTYQFADFGLAKDVEKQQAKLELVEELALELITKKGEASSRVEGALGRGASDRLRKILAQDLPNDPGVKEALGSHDSQRLADKYKNFYNALRALASDVPLEAIFQGFETLRRNKTQERLGYIAEQIARIQRGEPLEQFQGRSISPEVAKKIDSLANDLKDSPDFLANMLAGQEPDIENIALENDINETIDELPSTESGSESISKVGIRIGTPRYMSPEQTAGQLTTYKSDVYALGTVWYEMATGKPPINAKTISELLAAIPSQDVQAAQELRSELPEAFSNLLQRMLAKDPKDRPTMEEAHKQLLEIKQSMMVSKPQIEATKATQPAPEKPPIVAEEPKVVSPAPQKKSLLNRFFGR